MAGSGMQASNWGVFQTTTGGTVAAAVVGGTASALGGGKFANGAVTGAYTMLFNHLIHQKQVKNQDRFKGQLINDRNRAATFMQDFSIENEVEVSGWVVDEGIIVMPFEGENYQGIYQRNRYNRSHNNWFRVSSKSGAKYVNFNGRKYRLLGQIHTHPFNSFPSDADMNLALQISLPVVSVSLDYIVYTKGVLINIMPRSFNINDLFK